MTDNLESLEDWAAPLIARLSRSERRTLTRRVARDLRRSQAARIKSQRNPDGSAYAPRKPQNRRKQGGIRRRAMFSKIRTAKYLKLHADADSAGVGFTRHTAEIARVHQTGARARVNKQGLTYDYPARRLLGFAAGDVQAIRDSILHHLTQPL